MLTLHPGVIPIYNDNVTTTRPNRVLDLMILDSWLSFLCAFLFASSSWSFLMISEPFSRELHTPLLVLFLHTAPSSLPPSLSPLATPPRLLLHHYIPTTLLRVSQQVCRPPGQPRESTHFFKFALQPAFGMQERDIVGTANRDEVEKDVGDGSTVGKAL